MFCQNSVHEANVQNKMGRSCSNCYLKKTLNSDIKYNNVPNKLWVVLSGLSRKEFNILYDILVVPKIRWLPMTGHSVYKNTQNVYLNPFLILVNLMYKFYNSVFRILYFVLD